ncbi:disulfide bond formation protein DsbD [Pedobacter psychrophilus]|uniref:Disulfide bond formation protein DsbD n=1 Tax=Pedobacter psychrophilus TaxID=1826909 RepID=A0A179DBV2_9SPHI|nr:thioredoxin family protein [Pedobacter psychrophilus]OAQ38394.1 disulfide bond formation protein DsbD [Pedobacter psychrophilus]
MKKLFAFSAFFLISYFGFSQILKPVKWSFSSQNINEKEAYLIATATIEKGWHVYSQDIGEGGPIPTTLTFVKSSDYKLEGKTTETPKAVSAYDNNFGMQISWHESKAIFKQKIKLNKPELTVKGTLEFMVCNDKQCLPPEDVDFSISVKAIKNNNLASADVKTTSIPENNEIAITANDSSSIVNDTVTAVTNPVSVDAIKISAKPIEDKSSKQSLWAIFIAGFIGGLLALIMPCIFPMLPLTVSFFTKKAESRAKAISHAFIYGLSIIIIYVLLGLAITIFFGSDALNDLASNGTFNFLFFLLLVVFAVSFFGAFEITLPNSWANKMDEKSDKGGLAGLFFMAFALALVSFSCTGPIIGTLLVQAASMGERIGPAVGMFGFALALAIPFTLFAAFPSLLKSLPKSGGWLNSVKVTLGFIELALALKFLSNVDLAYHWELLDREVFLVLWIVIFAMLGFYILGKIKFSHDSDLPFITIPRLFISIIIFSFTIYMIPGLWGAPLKAISAWLPPQTTQDFDLYTNSLSSPNIQQDTVKKKYAGLFKAPHNLDAFFDYEQGLAYAKSQNKPVLIDFTGHSCVNCRKMEASVWSDKEVLSRLKENYVLISLYVDDKTDLPESEQYVSKFSGKKIKTLGNKWSDFQASTFATNSQPYYVIVNNTGKALVPPQAFNLEIKNYTNFLDSGLTAYRKNNK